MERNLIGLATDDLRLPVKTGVTQALHLGFGAVEIGAAAPEVSPRELSASGRRELGRFVRSQGLALAALGADPPDPRRLDSHNIDQRVEHARAVLEMAADVCAPMVTLQLGPLIESHSGHPGETAREMLEFLADRADRVGTALALRAAADDPAKIAALLTEIGCPALRVCLDPGLLLLSGQDPVQAIERLAGHLGLSHARDLLVSAASGRGQETNLGRGDVDFAAYFAALEEGGYHGAQIIRRSDTLHPLDDLAASKEYLDSLIRRTAR